MAPRGLASVALALCLLARGAAAAEITMLTTPLALDAGDPERNTVGALTYRGGLRLVSDSPAFGGLSALRLSHNGRQMLAITDRGSWFQAELQYDEGGNLVGVAHADLSPMLEANGRAVVPPRSDAESLVLRGDAAIVGFERVHRIARYPLDGEGGLAAARPQELPIPAALRRAPLNGGLETMTALQDGRLLAIAEELVDGDGLAGWIFDGADAAPLRYVPAAGFNPTDATTLANGDVLVLERRFTLFERAGRIVRIAKGDIQPGARLVGTEIARLTPPLLTDNFEGIDAVPAPDGGTLVFLVSDDNFTLLQRTLLLQFWMP